MSKLPAQLEIILVMLAGWMNRRQQAVIAYLRAENEILKAQLKGRPKLNHDERRRLAVLGKALGRKVLGEVATIVTPDTILHWHRRLIARKWTFRRRPGRPGVMREIRQWVVRMAKADPLWGYTSIRDRLNNLGHRVSRSTVVNILKQAGIEPAPKRSRSTPWSKFLKAHWSGLAAMDFTTVEVWTSRGLVTYYVLFVMELATRKVACAGITPHPDTSWLKQIGRQLTDSFSGFLRGKKFVLMDRAGYFSEAFRNLLKQAGVRPVRVPASSPNCNAHIERFIGSFKREVNDRLIFFGEEHLRHTTREYLAYYHQERNHQGIDSRIIEPGKEVGIGDGQIRHRERLGGMLNHFYREAA
jgi:putative transposase